MFAGLVYENMPDEVRVALHSHFIKTSVHLF